MSFLHHDMTPMDHNPTFKRAQSITAKMPPTSHAKTDITSRGRAEGTTVKAPNGKTIMTDHFLHGGFTLDGHARDDKPPQPKPAANLPAEGLSIAYGVSSSQERARTMSADGRATLKRQPNLNDPASVQQQELVKRQQLKATLDQQIEEKKNALKGKEQLVMMSTGYYNEEAPSNPRKPRLLDQQKYSQKSMAEPTIPRNTRPFLEKKQRDPQYLADIVQQQKEQAVQKAEERNKQYALSESFADSLELRKVAANPKISRAYTASSPIEQMQLSPELREERHLQMEAYANELRAQMNAQKVLSADDDSVTSGGRPISMKLPKKQSVDVVVKPHDNGRMQQLYDANPDINYAEMLENASAQPMQKSPIYALSPEELQAKADQRSILDQQTFEKLQLKIQNDAQEQALLEAHRSHFPFENNKRPKLGKHKAVKLHQDSPEVERLRQERNDKFKTVVIEHSNSSQLQKQQSRQQERKQDYELSKADPWKWNQDLLVHEQRAVGTEVKSNPISHAVAQPDLELREHLRQQMEEDDKRRSQIRQQKLTEEMIHVEKSFVNKLDKGDKHQRATVASIEKTHKMMNDVGIDPHRRSKPVPLNSFTRTQMDDDKSPRRTKTDHMTDIISHQAADVQ